MAIAKIDPQTLYAGGYNGVTKQGAFYYTHNGGATWTAGASGLNGSSVQAIVRRPNSGVNGVPGHECAASTSPPMAV